MIAGAQVSGDPQPSEMQLAGRLALSAAALLLLTLVYRYYKSRVSAGSTKGSGHGKADAGQDAEQEKPPVCTTMERKKAPEGLRPQLVQRKITGPAPRAEDWPVGEPAAVGTPGLRGTPVGGELSKKKEAEVQEEQTEQAMSHLRTGRLPDDQGLAPEEKEIDASRAACSNGEGMWASNGTAAMELGGRLSSLGLLSQGRSSCSPNGGHQGSNQDAGWVSADKPAGRAPHPESERGELALGGEEGWPPGDNRSAQATQSHDPLIGQETIQSFHAASNMGVVTLQSSRQVFATRTFSSVAEVRMEESFVQDRRLKDGPPGTSLRGKVYDYYVQSVSQAVVQESPSCATPASQPLCAPSATSVSNSGPEERLHQEASQGPATEEEKSAVVEVLGQSSETPLNLTQGDSKAVQIEDQSKIPAGGNPTQKPAGVRYGFSRKESFHEIAENPELQMPMEGFGSLASVTTGLDAPASSSVSALEASLQSDAAEKPTVELVAGAKFFHIPLSASSSVDIHLDLGNCYEVLCMAKKQKLEGLREAAYKVMSDNYLQVLKTHAIYSHLNARERDLILQRRMRGRKYVAVADVSSQVHGPHASRLCCYDDKKDTWHLLAHLPLETISRGSAVCSMFNYLFVVAGCTGQGRNQRPSNRVFCYNPLTKIWQEICALNQARPHCKLVALDGHLYAIGGECLYTVERYDPRRDRWTFVAPLPNDTFAVAHTATVCDGEIYVTGGTLRYMLLRYVSRVDAWKVSLTGGSKDRTTEMVTTNGFIYRFDLNRSQGISVYRCSARAKLWYECATYPVPFPACFQCAVVDNLIYCISQQFHVRFLADYVSPRFGARELQKFPSPRGTLFPVILVLPDGEVVQTRV